MIEKTEAAGKTKTNVIALNQESKVQEIVRLLGGNDETEYALKHAEELLKQAEEFKQSIP